jgi:hypothetical protein
MVKQSNRAALTLAALVATTLLTLTQARLSFLSPMSLQAKFVSK